MPNDDSVSDGGGGIYNEGTFTMTNSTVSGNTAHSNQSKYGGLGFGGGIYNQGTFTMTNSTVSDNSSSGSGGNSLLGGGIVNVATFTMTNSTVSGNSSSSGGDGVSTQSLLPHTIANLKLIFCTIVDNSASGRDGFDIANIADAHIGNAPSSQVYMKASIVGGNDTQHNPIAGLITSGGYNLVQHMSSENFDASTAHTTDHSLDDLTGVLGAHPQLQKNGGVTQSYQLIPRADNPAVDEIPLDACTDSNFYRVLTDQRGMPRPGKNKQSCDSGAYETQR